jgi:hypothetical protein
MKDSYNDIPFQSKKKLGDLTSISNVVSSHTTKLAETGTDLEDRGVNLKLLGLKGDGSTDDTTALSTALNSTSEKFFAPSGEYLLTNTITVNSPKVKVITGAEGTVFKIALSSSKTLFDLLTNVIFKNIVFDFSNSYCKTAFAYKANFGEVKLYNVEIRNIKDIDSTTSSTLINIPAEGNKIDIERIYFKNILKRGNGSVTDGAGSINGIYYNGSITTPSALGGSIKNIKVENMHNINSSEAIIYEDTAGVYIGLGGKKSNVKIVDVEGLEFGKRLLKIQASDIEIDRVKGVSNSGDTLGVIGVLAEYGSFDCDNAKISNVTCEGKMEYAIATYASNSKLRNCNINTTGNDVGLYIDGKASNTSAKDFTITSNRPISIGNSTVKIENLIIKDFDITVLPTGFNAISSATAGYKGITFDSITLNTSDLPNQSQFFFATPSSVASSENLLMRNITQNAKDAVQSGQTYARSLLTNVWNTTGLYIENYKYTNLADGLVADALTLENCSKVEINDLYFYGKANRSVLMRNCNKVNIGKLNSKLGSGVSGDFVIISSTEVTLDSYNEQYKISYATQDATEVMRNRGITAQRPKRAYQSFRFFDTTLYKDIIVKTGAVIAADGTVTTNPVWVDAMGTVV